MTVVQKLKAYGEKQMALDPYEHLDGDDARKLLVFFEAVKDGWPEEKVCRCRVCVAMRELEKEGA